MLAACGFVLLSGRAVFALDLDLPALCRIGQDCFVQQYPDMGKGSAAVDPFCGTATYDGHDGTDLRILSMADVERGVPVVAMADGKVLRLRDGEPDRLVTSQADRTSVSGKECGNGMIVDHGEGIEVQYCHMRQGSLLVQPGETVKRGQRLGAVGASGLAQFPHVHVTVRRNGEDVDPVTGKPLAAGCLVEGEARHPLFSAEIVDALGEAGPQIIALGLAGGPIDHAALSVSGPPSAAKASSPAIVGWAWFINLRRSDRVVVRLVGPDGQEIALNRSDPMDRNKADYSAFGGKKGAPASGVYRVTAGVERDGKALFNKSGEFRVE
ncbi:peptidase M23 [Mesorhizobium sp. L-8-10]|uniref:M23 family metallopeptidase n=1 Tax=Mesorhizobium sp. L-8-10 TaxID=2744523 RepID=UPI0019278F8C|nr:M23 family metallopeptidase [Mesorhizobium sp. L-8-10]BCH29733.1 peptidase M23 [Mesorhizobium sp. L-8-10]